MSIKLGSTQVVVVSSPTIAKQVMKTHDLVFCSRPKRLGQHKLSYNGSDIAFAPYSESSRELKKLCIVHLLSNKPVKSFKGIREDEVLQMIKKLSIKASSGEVANLNVIIFSLVSTLICRTAFGKINGDDGSDFRRFDELMIECQSMLGGFFFSHFLPSFGWLLDKLSGTISRLDKIWKDFDDFYNEIIDAHLNPSRPKPQNPDILDILIQLMEEKLCSIDLNWDNIKAILFDIFVAGTDTATATIIWTMTALMKNPSKMKRLQKEIRDLVQEKGKVDEDDLPKLPYLKSVVKEVLRLYPPAPLMFREARENCEIEGHTLKPKTSIYINAWAIATDPEYWENPDEFIPERFLNTSIDILGNDFTVIPFGAGRKGCPGILMGLAIIEIALANLLYAFNWELPHGMRHEDVDNDVFPGLTMHKKNPLYLVPNNYIK